MKEIVSFLKDLREEVLIFPNSDLLVHIDSNKTCKYEKSGDLDLQKLRGILKKANSLERKSGINPICISKGIVRITNNFKTNIAPIFLIPVELEFIKSNDSYTLVELEEEKILNPYLVNQFKIPAEEEASIKEIEDFQSACNVHSEDCEEEISFVGNFHPKRFSFLREIDELIDKEKGYSDALNEICGNESSGRKIQLKTNYHLFRNDDDQLQVYDKLSEASVVVQGPPGTGKSQVIGNLLGDMLNSNKSVLLCSEKKVALDVIENKLNSKGLNLLSFQIPSRHPNRAFIFELKNGWDFFNQLKPKPIQLCFKDFQKQLNIYNVINEEAQKQKCSTFELIELIERNRKTDFQLGKRDNIRIDTYNSSLNIIKQIPVKVLSIAKTINPIVLNEAFLKFSKELAPVIKVLNELKSKRKKIVWKDLHLILYQLLQFHSFKQDSYNKYGHFIREKDEFKRLEKDYYNNRRIIEALDSEQQHWLRHPSLQELEFLYDLFKKKHLLKYKIKWFFTWRKWSRSPSANPESQIKNRIKYNKKKARQSTLENKLFDIGIQDIETELPLINSLIENTDIHNWNLYLENKDTEENNISHKDLYRAINFLKHSFDFEPNDEPIYILNKFMENKEHLLESWPKLILLPKNIFPYLSERIEEIKTTVERSIYSQILIRNPELKKFSLNHFIDDCNSINSNFGKESDIYAQQLISQQYELFKNYEDLTKTPPRKLSDEQKTFRAKLKKGKSILVKEFGKKRAHRSIRDLFDSEALLWIRILKPIWMSNPNALADSIPLKNDLFDYLIADEASQLLLSHSVGALQRARRTIICGDPEQMSPSSFFKKKQSLEIDLLHHANYYLKHIFLSNHYRSAHPHLISYSNNHFYGNRLKAFQDTNVSENPIEHHYIKNGEFTNRKNVIEAQKVASFITKNIRKKEKLGIVAFSETQLECVYEHLSQEIKILLENRIDDDTLFFQPLEKVQGDECDRLVVSFGYGFNTEKKFEMRFGPVNLNHGHKRLNVLFSRAKQNIDFFSSVTYSDFPKTENKGVIHLKEWFKLIQNREELKQIDKNISIKKILEDCNGFNDLISYLNVYQDRGHQINTNLF